jgi:phosphoenolpyruvate phosphomutase
MKDKEIVYAAMVGDLFHRGHLEFIKKAKKLGDFLIIGLHPDDVVKKYKREPIIPFEDRKRIIESIREVDMVVEDCMDFRRPTMFDNLKKYNVTKAVHGDDWFPPLYQRAKEEKLCKVVQVESYPYISTTKLLKEIRKTESLKYLLENKRNLVVVSAGDAITAKLIEESEFDGIWVSGFEASARLGLVDNGCITMTEMLNTTKIIVDATSLPTIVDVDNGYGGLHNFIRTVKEFEKIGCSGICVEDNIFPKQNSLWGRKAPLLSMEEHGTKIRAGKDTQKTREFIIIARTEALIRGYGIREAIRRAYYYAECGADMVLIHSRESTGKEALEIPKHWESSIPLVIAPTKFPHLTNKQLFDAGFSMIVLANQTERVKIKAIRESLKIIKKHDCVYPIEKTLSATLDDMRDLTPIKEIEENERRYKKEFKFKSIRKTSKTTKKNDYIYPIEKTLSATLDDMRDLTPIKEK